MIVIDFDGWAAREEPNGDYFRVWSRVCIYHSEVINKEAELVLLFFFFFFKNSCLQNLYFFCCHVSCEGSGTSLLFSSLKSQRRRTSHSKNYALTEKRSTEHQKEYEFPSFFRLSLWIYVQTVLNVSVCSLRKHLSCRQLLLSLLIFYFHICDLWGIPYFFMTYFYLVFIFWPLKWNNDRTNF